MKSVFQGVDTPKSPSTRGVGAWRTGLTADEQAEARARLLATTKVGFRFFEISFCGLYDL